MKKAMPANRQGFSLIEILIVIAVLMIILVLSVAAFYTLTRKTDLDASRDNIISTLNTARNKTLASEEATRYGVYFDTLNSPHRYILFQGQDYSSRIISSDKVYNLPSAVEISALSLNGATNEIVFKRLEGNTNNYGSLTLSSLSTGETKNIYIYSSGEISTQIESASGSGRILDSRHTHFNLGWDISGADVLKFDFINAGQIQQVMISDYFGSTSFDWTGEFEINGAYQEFGIHTHQLSPNTLLCIHRDRNDGKNNQEVYIYIIHGGIEKEIAHYDDDQNATVYKGTYVWGTMEIQ